MKKIRVSICCYILGTLLGFGTNLKISEPILYREKNAVFTVFNVRWDNAWNTTKNHDAVWIFLKSIPNQGRYKHINVVDAELISLFSDSNIEIGFELDAQGTGLFLFPNSEYRGTIECTLKIKIDPKSLNGIHPRKSTLKAYGVEMVYVPEGVFTLGDANEDAKAYGSFYKPNENKMSLVTLNSESKALIVGEKGDLYYNKTEGYEGDQTGTIPEAFPKGVASFYIMKYEISEGLYTNFLNSLDNETQQIRDITLEENYISNGGSIFKSDSNFETPYPDKPCWYTSWEDAMSLADWAGLRPMTEFEFTKACRGNRVPIANDFPWGTHSKLRVQRLPNADGVLQMVNDWEEDKLSDTTLEYFGGSHYWVMDLSGSLWERVVSIGHPNGRAFSGSHGDGILSIDGQATNTDWPSGMEGAGGVGYRGGGFYGFDRFYHEYNPFSPIGYRPYGAWHGIKRDKVYGGRFVRTAR